MNMAWVYLLILCLCCYAIYKIITAILLGKGIELTSGKKIMIGWIIVIIAVIPYWIYTENKSIKDGEIYYINLFSNKDSPKNYRVPGMIYKDEYGYHLFEVYWPNGNTTSFETSSYRTDLEIGSKVEATDDNGEVWFIELTKEKAKIDNNR